MTALGKVLVVLALLAGLFGAGWLKGWTTATDAAKGREAHAENQELRRLNTELRAAQKAREEVERRLSDVGKKHVEELANAEAAKERVLDQLRNGGLRLREHWACPTVPPTASASAGNADDAAELRNEGASDLVRLAAECDATIRSLQKVTEEDRRAP